MSINWDSNDITLYPCHYCLKIPKKKMTVAKIDSRWLMFCSTKCFEKTAYKISQLKKENKNA